jgi:exodeoxyribonuclease VII small subunit
MSDENYTFTQARTRLEEIVAQVRSKDVSLEKSLDLLEEGVRLANICTEQSDHTEWRSVVDDEAADETTGTQTASETEAESPEEASPEDVAEPGSAEVADDASRDAGSDVEVSEGADVDGSMEHSDEPAGPEEDASGTDQEA